MICKPSFRNCAALIFTVVMLVGLVSWLQPVLQVDHKRWHQLHDPQIRKHAKHYFGVVTDWRWFRAQSIVESGLRQQATSHRGAVGLMQILPSTFEEIWKHSWLKPSIDEARWNIASGIAYDRYLFNRWRQQLPSVNVWEFMLASYNAGHNGVNRLRKKAASRGARSEVWSEVAPFAAEETRNYVARIKSLMTPPG